MDNTNSGRDTSPSLLERIRDPRNAEAWKTFMDIYAPLIYRYLRRRGLQDADAADVGQEVLSQVGRSIRTFTYQPERGRFRDWLGTVTRNKLWRFLQRQSRLAGHGTDEASEALHDLEAPATDGEWTADFNARVLQAALDRVRLRFEPASWQAFERTWVAGRAAAETASELGLSIDAVYVAKSRVLKCLREEVLNLAEDVPLLASADLKQESERG